MTTDIEKRIESLETTRAFHADTLKRIADRVDKLSEAFRARTDELAALLESAINLGQHQAAQQTDGNLRLGVSMDAMQESLIRLQQDTANRIAGLTTDVRNQTNAIVRLDNDDETIHAEMQSRTEQLSDRVTKLNAGLELSDRAIDTLAQRIRNLQKDRNTTGEFIRYVHADDLRAVIREVCVHAFASRNQFELSNTDSTAPEGSKENPFMVGQKETARRGNISIQDGQGNEKRDAPYNSRI